MLAAAVGACAGSVSGTPENQAEVLLPTVDKTDANNDSTAADTATGTDAGVLAKCAIPLTWPERILKPDCSVDIAQYDLVAAHYSDDDVLKYRFGPGGRDFGASPTTTTIAQSGKDGIAGPADPKFIDGGWTDWFAMSGQLAYVPDQTGDPGIASARNGSVYCDTTDDARFSGILPLFDFRVAWAPDPSNPWNGNPDPGIAALPKTATRPVAVGRSRYMTSVTGAAVFPSGLVTTVSTGNDPQGNELSSYPSLNLAAGKVPTAVAMTLNHEFVLVTVWDTINHKGQLAVIAVEGNPPAINSGPHFLGDIWMWGVPNWPAVRAMKLLGYVDLPIMAPTSIEASADKPIGTGRDQPTNRDLDLSKQTQRDDWYRGTGLKATARTGYAIIASRAEQKVVFVDLEPLYAYYREMYFTTPEKYLETTKTGASDAAWPPTFSVVSAQQPKVVGAVDVAQPTAVAAGFARGSADDFGNWFWDDTLDPNVPDTGVFGKTAYVGTMAGELLLFDTTSLQTVGATKTIPTIKGKVAIARNPVTIDYGLKAFYMNPNNLYILSRGDATLFRLRDNGDIVSKFTDSRMSDPVSMEMSCNFRSCGGWGSLSVLDFEGKKVVNYVTAQKPFRDELPGTVDYGWYWGHTSNVPGKPYIFSIAEVM